MSGFLLRASRIALYLALTLPLTSVQAAVAGDEEPVLPAPAGHLSRLVLPHPGHYARTARTALDRIARRSSSPITPPISTSRSSALRSRAASSPKPKSRAGRFRLARKAAAQRSSSNATDRAGAARQRDEIRDRLDHGDNLILFPEGTSNDGIHLLPFKSALFAAAEDRARSWCSRFRSCTTGLTACRSGGSIARSSPGMAIWRWRRISGRCWGWDS